jgi:hypothetical protein
MIHLRQRVLKSNGRDSAEIWPGRVEHGAGAMKWLSTWLSPNSGIVTNYSRPANNSNSGNWCRGADLNRRHLDFQSSALPS